MSPDPTTISRRGLLKGGVAVGGLAAFAGLGGGFRWLTAAEASTLREALDSEVIHTGCVMCPSECSLSVRVEGGVASAIYGNEHAPFNSGVLCAKGAAGLQMTYNANRIKYPMIRVGERGEGKFRRATWDEALDHIADKLLEIKEEDGPEAVIMDTGDVTDRDAYYYFARAFGTPHTVEHGSICDTPRRHGPKLMFGGKRVEPDVMRPSLVRQPDGTLKNDYSYRTKLIIYAGWNPFTATRIAYESRGTVEAKLAGCRLVVIDPAMSNTATKADQWMPIRPGTDADLFAAMLRYILEHHDDDDAFRRYIDWSFLEYSQGWEEFEEEFRSWWSRTDPINGLEYFTVAWAAQRTDISEQQVAELSHAFGITKPAALIWGMNGIGHHYNGYVASILGTALNTITGNMDVPGGAIDTELAKASKGGAAGGGRFNSREITRTIDGQQVSGTQGDLHMDHNGDWPSAWDDVVGDYPRRFREGVKLRYGPFRGHEYPIRAFIQRAGNAVYTATNPRDWIDALTAKDGDDYKVDLVVYIDTPLLETGMYADVILPEASYLERMSLSDIYPSHPMIYLKDFVIDKMHESKTHYDIAWALADRLHAKGDPDIDPADFSEAYPTEEDFWNEALSVSPGRPNAGEPRPYPNLPAGYKMIGTPESLEAGNVEIDDENREIRGEPVTAQWLRDHHGVAVWPMSWGRFGDGGILQTDSGKVEFVWDWEGDEDGEVVRKGRYAPANLRIEEAGMDTPPSIEALGWEKFPKTFYWFETIWNPWTNPEYAELADEYPFSVVSGRIHHAMSGTQMVDWLGRIATEDLWMPFNDRVEVAETVLGEDGPTPTGHKVLLEEGTWNIGVIQMNAADGASLGLATGDLVDLESPLGDTTRGKVNVVETIRPGTLRIALGAGGRFSPGLGKTYAFRDVAPNSNAVTDPRALSPIMGQPAYCDMVVKIRKVAS